VLLAQDEPDLALTLLQRLLDGAVSQARTGSIIEIQALRALTLAARGDDASAIGALTEARTLARRHGHVRVFADEGAPMRVLLTRLPAAQKGERGAATPRGLAEPLTGRELEVLRLIAAGKSNQRIAHDLVVALDTVKKHVSHVMGKLGAANRTEAAARARQLGLIP
jgi:LuxR family maltose regulon positive regulatory protein